MKKVDGFQFWVPQGITNVMQLFSAYAVGLSAPNGYFGENWDAFGDCLLDLQWIDKFEVIIVHRELPSLPGSACSIYLDILQHSVAAWADKKTSELHKVYSDYIPHRLAVFFPN